MGALSNTCITANVASLDLMVTFNLRGLLVLTLFAAIALTCYLAFRGKPRGYLHLDEIIRLQASDKSLSGASWEVHISPDATGPFRSAGNDWSGSGPYQLAPGRGAHGSIDTGTEIRKFDHEGIPGMSFLVFLLEDKDDRATYLIMKRADGDD